MRILCFNPGHERARPSLSDDRAGRALRQPGNRGAAVQARCFPCRPRTSRIARSRHRAVHASTRIPGRATRADRRRSEARDRDRRRRDDAVDRPPACALWRTAHRHQSWPTWISHRYRVIRDGIRALCDALRSLCRRDPDAARRDADPRDGQRRAHARAQRRRRQSRRARRHDRLRGDHRRTFRVRDARRRRDRRDPDRFNRLRALGARTHCGSPRTRDPARAGRTARADQSSYRRA